MSALGTSGWKARQLAARRKRNHGRTPEERDRIRAIRKAHKERQRQIEAGELVEDAPTEGAPEATEPETATEAPEPEPEAPVSDESEPSGEPELEAGAPSPADMDRDALIAELQDAGERVHPASKDATLRAKVEALRE